MSELMYRETKRELKKEISGLGRVTIQETIRDLRPPLNYLMSLLHWCFPGSITFFIGDRRFRYKTNWFSSKIRGSPTKDILDYAVNKEKGQK